jgi:hypothetical protein
MTVSMNIQQLLWRIPERNEKVSHTLVGFISQPAKSCCNDDCSSTSESDMMVKSSILVYDWSLNHFKSCPSKTNILSL